MYILVSYTHDVLTCTASPCGSGHVQTCRQCSASMQAVVQPPAAVALLLREDPLPLLPMLLLPGVWWGHRVLPTGVRSMHLLLLVCLWLLLNTVLPTHLGFWFWGPC